MARIAAFISELGEYSDNPVVDAWYEYLHNWSFTYEKDLKHKFRMTAGASLEDLDSTYDVFMEAALNHVGDKYDFGPRVMNELNSILIAYNASPNDKSYKLAYENALKVFSQVPSWELRTIINDYMPEWWNKFEETGRISSIIRKIAARIAALL